MKTLIILLFVAVFSITNCYSSNKNFQPDLISYSSIIYNDETNSKNFSLNIYELITQFTYRINSEYEVRLANSQKLLFAFNVIDLINYNPQEAFGSTQTYNEIKAGLCINKTVLNITIESDFNQFQSTQLGITFQL